MSFTQRNGGHEKCGATTRNGQPCQLAAGQGTDHVGYGYCKHHTGMTPSGVKHAQRLQHEAAVIEFGARRDIDAPTALIETLQHKAGEVSYWRTVLGANPSPESPALKQLVEAEKDLARISERCLEIGLQQHLVKTVTAQSDYILDLMVSAVTIARQKPEDTPETVARIVLEEYTQ